MKYCTNQCSGIRPELPAQIRSGYYQNTERVSPNTSRIMASAVSEDPYEQSFPNYEADFRYFTKMYPPSVRSVVPAVREAVGQLEFKGSMMFDLYPEFESVRMLAEAIAKESDVGIDCIFLLLLHEFMMRRERYRSTLKSAE